MTQCNNVTLNFSDSQIDKLKSAVKAMLEHF